MDEFVQVAAPSDASEKVATRSPQIVSLDYAFFDARRRRGY